MKPWVPPAALAGLVAVGTGAWWLLRGGSSLDAIGERAGTLGAVAGLVCVVLAVVALGRDDDEPK